VRRGRRLSVAELRHSTIALHLFGSLLMTFAGIATVSGLLKARSS
jgi:hypothetical protein